MRRIFLGLAAGLLVACTGPGEQAFEAPISASSKSVSDWSLRSVRVGVPRTLTVSRDPDVRYPKTDIVWWEDPAGDRRAQVQRIVSDAVKTGAQPMRGSKGVLIDVQVLQFHAVTPRARAIGRNSWHDITLAVAVRDQRTGEVLAKTVLMPDLDALHGEEATAAVARGDTQKARISRQIASVVRQWLVSSGADFAAQARLAAARPAPSRVRRTTTPRRTQPARPAAAPVVAAREDAPPATAGQGDVVAEVSADVDAAQEALSVEVGLSINEAATCEEPEDGEFCP